MRIFCLTILFLTTGCAYTAMDAKITPSAQVAESTIGAGRMVGVTVVDERPTRDIGNRSSVGGKIKMNDDLAVIYQGVIVDGLRKKGFDAKPGTLKDAPNLKVEIRSLAYQFDAGWWTVGSRVDSSFKAIVNGTVPYERLYRADDENRGAFAAGAKDNNKQLNEVVNSTLRQMFEDQKLMEVLATP